MLKTEEHKQYKQKIGKYGNWTNVMITWKKSAKKVTYRRGR
jgi:hypothetical protein